MAECANTFACDCTTSWPFSMITRAGMTRPSHCINEYWQQERRCWDQTTLIQQQLGTIWHCSTLAPEKLWQAWAALLIGLWLFWKDIGIRLPIHENVSQHSTKPKQLRWIQFRIHSNRDDNFLFGKWRSVATLYIKFSARIYLVCIIESACHPSHCCGS